MNSNNQNSHQNYTCSKCSCKIIIGPTGPPGRDGLNGIGQQGIAGPTGPGGRVGPTGEPGRVGPTGPPGYTVIGPTGVTGPTGPPGIGKCGPPGPVCNNFSTYFVKLKNTDFITVNYVDIKDQKVLQYRTDDNYNLINLDIARLDTNIVSFRIIGDHPLIKVFMTNLGMLDDPPIESSTQHWNGIVDFKFKDIETYNKYVKDGSIFNITIRWK